MIVIASIAMSITAAGCVVDPNGDGDDEDESEPQGESNSELRSNVSCKESTESAYENGKAYNIQVITVGGKKISKAAGHAFLKLQAAAAAAGPRAAAA